ncbi:MAG: pyruvate formate-lyase [Prevotellaceae bacterium]|jgi:formate C-acetyltransferase|nr:pyruvate formate-lyase [Prevotellaceae bacterium]
MNKRIETLRAFIMDKQHHQYRRSPEVLGIQNLSETYEKQGLSPVKRTAANLAAMFERENPVILPGEQIVFTRTVSAVPDLFTQAEWDDIKSRHYLHERGYVCNISPDYATTLTKGLEVRKREILAKLEDKHNDAEATEFLQAVLQCVNATQQLTEKYRQYALSLGEAEIAATLHAVQTGGAKTFREALQLLRILHYTLWASGNYHNTLGRFDQYMYPFYANDLKSGVLTEETAFDLLEEFFLVCNKDSDLYPGMQQGDNGQSLVLGGRSLSGECLFNDLSKLCLKASYALNLIDPKINIRVDKDMPLEIYRLGSELTKIGLGFPQYSNDDIVIPGLIAKGYDKEDAYNYVVAACWEFILPEVAMDIPNIDAISLIECVGKCVEKLDLCINFEDFMLLVEAEIKSAMEIIHNKHRSLWMVPAPVMSLLMKGTIEKGRDISLGAKYNNYGIHGTGIAPAVDSLAAIRKYYFEEKTLSYETLTGALRNNFEGHAELRERLRDEAPKMGQDDDFADAIACDLLNRFDNVLQGYTNERGGIYRAGTGTAMYYVWHAKDLGATPDGRNAGEAIPANYSPALFMKQKGPVSVIKSFTKPDLQRVINGGPLTLEFDQSIFKNRENVDKLAHLVQMYIALGGHQLQLNTVSREKLLDAKIHPENHRNLIVRVWGWSGYFVELDECYQDHVINRIEFGV